MQRILGPGSRACGVRALAVIALAMAVLSASVADAQILERAIVIRDATVVTARGFVIENGDVVIKKGEIVEVGRDVKAPLLSRKIDGRGKTVTPGFIDIRSGLAVSGTASIARAHVSAADVFDRYATEEIQAALAQGVTAVYLPAGRAQGIHGLGSVIRLVPDKNTDACGEVETRESALCIDLASNSTAVARLRMFVSVQKHLRSARDYRTSRDEYFTAIEEYEKKLVEYAEKVGEKGDGKEGDGKKGNGKKGDAKKGDAEKKGADSGKRKLAPRGPPRRGKPGGVPAKKGKEKKKEKEKKSEKDEAPKKPREVMRRDDAEVMLRALDREIPVRVEAHRTSDILNALALAKEFRLRLILEGATEAHLLAEQIAEAKVAVVLTDLDTDGTRLGRDLRASADNGRILRDAGVKVYVGSGGSRGAARFPMFAAQLAAARGVIGDPLLAVTSGAARFLGLDEKIGSIRKGRAADLVIWNGDPRDPASTVDTVFVGGRVAYERGVPR